MRDGGDEKFDAAQGICTRPNAQCCEMLRSPHTIAQCCEMLRSPQRLRNVTQYLATKFRAPAKNNGDVGEHLVSESNIYSPLHTSIVRPATMSSAADKMHEVFQTLFTCSDAKVLFALCAREIATQDNGALSGHSSFWKEG